MRWSKDNVMLLVKMWGRGESASDIAEELGTTRNAVIGKANRLKLRHNSDSTRVSREPQKRTSYKEAGFLSRFKHLDPGPDTQCKWPMSDNIKDPDFSFCGAAVLERPYCPEHCAVAYRGKYDDVSSPNEGG